MIDPLYKLSIYTIENINVFKDNRMNASDIVKKKQNQLLYNTYYKPTVYQSTVFSTVTILSSILTGTSPLPPYVSTDISYSSTLTTYNNYKVGPIYKSYEMIANINSINQEKYNSELQWKNTTSSLQYAYSTINSSFGANAIIIPSTVRVTSSFMLSNTGPVIQSFVDYNQRP
jgi:hypothetical protein